MHNIYLHVADASGTLAAHIKKIEKGFARAVNTGSKSLGLSRVDVVCVDNATSAIPETGVGGFTDGQHLIYLYIDPSKEIDENEVYYTLCHEMHHAKRFAGPGYGKTLIDTLVFEGLAVNFECEVAESTTSFFSSYLQDKNDGLELLNKMSAHFDDIEFNYYEWFITGFDEYPRWAGYRAGTLLVAEYLKKTNKKASELALEDSIVFRNFAHDILGETLT